MRIGFQPATAAVAAHAALTTGTHGVTGEIVGEENAQTLINKLIGAGGLEWDNEGSGGNPVITSDSVGQKLSLAGQIQASQDFRTSTFFSFKNGTLYWGDLKHANTVDRVYTFPDASDTIAVLALAQTLLNKTLGSGTVLGENLNCASYYLYALSELQFIDGNPFIQLSSASNRTITIQNSGAGSINLNVIGTILENAKEVATRTGTENMSNKTFDACKLGSDLDCDSYDLTEVNRIEGLSTDLEMRGNNAATFRVEATNVGAGLGGFRGDITQLTDGIAAPAAVVGQAQLYVDTADGDLKVRFGDGTIKTIVTDT